MASQTLIAITAILVSGGVGLGGLLLNLRKTEDTDTVERAERRTQALQMLSDEEFTLMQVEMECLIVQ